MNDDTDKLLKILIAKEEAAAREKRQEKRKQTSSAIGRGVQQVGKAVIGMARPKYEITPQENYARHFGPAKKMPMAGTRDWARQNRAILGPDDDISRGNKSKQYQDSYTRRALGVRGSVTSRTLGVSRNDAKKHQDEYTRRTLGLRRR